MVLTVIFVQRVSLQLVISIHNSQTTTRVSELIFQRLLVKHNLSDDERLNALINPQKCICFQIMKSMESKIHFSSAGFKEYDWLVVYSPLQDWEYCVLLAKDTGYKNCSKLDRLVKSITL